MNLSNKEIENLEKFIGIDNIVLKGSLGFKDNSDFKFFPSENIKSGDLYIVNDSGTYHIKKYKSSEVELLEGDIVVCKQDKEFAFPSNDDWIRITRLLQNNFYIRCFVSYPIEKIMENDSSFEKFKYYKKEIEDKLLKSYLLVNNTCVISFTNDEFKFADEILRYKNNPVDFTIDRLKKLQESDYICFYKGWDEDPICLHEYEIAKLLNKNIIIHTEK